MISDFLKHDNECHVCWWLREAMKLQIRNPVSAWASMMAFKIQPEVEKILEELGQPQFIDQLEEILVELAETHYK